MAGFPSGKCFLFTAIHFSGCQNLSLVLSDGRLALRPAIAATGPKIAQPRGNPSRMLPARQRNAKRASRGTAPSTWT